MLEEPVRCMARNRTGLSDCGCSGHARHGRRPTLARKGAPGTISGDASLRYSACLFRIGAGLGGPSLIDRLLLVDADLVGDGVPFARSLIEDGFRILASPQPADRLPQRLFVLVG